MAYSPTTWNDGDVITKEKLNKLETGVQSADAAASVKELTGSAAQLTKIATPAEAQASEIATKVNEIIDQLIARGIVTA